MLITGCEFAEMMLNNNKRMLFVLHTSSGDQYRLDIDASSKKIAFSTIAAGQSAVTILGSVSLT